MNSVFVLNKPASAFVNQSTVSQSNDAGNDGHRCVFPRKAVRVHRVNSKFALHRPDQQRSHDFSAGGDDGVGRALCQPIISTNEKNQVDHADDLTDS